MIKPETPLSTAMRASSREKCRRFRANAQVFSQRKNIAELRSSSIAIFSWSWQRVYYNAFFRQNHSHFLFLSCHFRFIRHQRSE
ncbi:MAG: hypothetical protein U0984_17845 [Prosthecobacter sp.]|nr:hypothetical protein [Prosthecobacter sp.]